MKRVRRDEFLAFCRYVRSLHPAEARLHCILDNFSSRPDHAAQVRLIRRCIAWRNYNADDPEIRAIVDTANVTWCSPGSSKGRRG